MEFYGAHVDGAGAEGWELEDLKHAAKALADALPAARALGIKRVLLTCDEDNAGSRGTIEKNGGRYEDSRNGKRRYWIDNGEPAGSARIAR